MPVAPPPHSEVIMDAIELVPDLLTVTSSGTAGVPDEDQICMLADQIVSRGAMIHRTMQHPRDIVLTEFDKSIANLLALGMALRSAVWLEWHPRL